MTSIDCITLEVADPTAAERFYADAFGLDKQVRVRAAEADSSGFRGFTVSLVVSQPSIVDGLMGAALGAGATELKPAKKSLWGYGGVVQAPDGTIWQLASSSKKDTGPDSRQIDEIVLLLGVSDMAATKRFYVERGLKVAKSFRQQVRRVRRFVESHQVVAVRASRPGQGRRCPRGGQRVAPAHDRRRRRDLHRPGRIHVGALGLTSVERHGTGPP